MQIKDVLLGSDPEFFLRDKTTKRWKSGVGLIGGTKKEPCFILGSKYLAHQEDNVLLEINVSPTTSPKQMYDEVKLIHQYILDNQLKGTNLEIVARGSAIFDYEELDTPQAQEAGCEPDYNAWSLQENERLDIGSTNLRSCGGHLAVGYSNPNYETSILIVRTLDLFLTVPMLLLDPDESRKQLYGKAGAHRIKKNYVELRTMSNHWFTSQEMVNWVFENTFKAIDAINDGFYIDEEVDDCKAIINAINKNDKDIAQYLVDKYSINCNIEEAINTEKVNQ